MEKNIIEQKKQNKNDPAKSFFYLLLKDIKINNKKYHCNNLVDYFIIKRIEQEDDFPFKNKIINVIKNWKYTKLNKIDILLFYINIINKIRKEDTFWVKNKNLSTNAIKKKFTELFNKILGENTGRKKFEILKYWQWLQTGEIYNFLFFLQKEWLLNKSSDFNSSMVDILNNL